MLRLVRQQPGRELRPAFEMNSLFPPSGAQLLSANYSPKTTTWRNLCRDAGEVVTPRSFHLPGATGATRSEASSELLLLAQAAHPNFPTIEFVCQRRRRSCGKIEWATSCSGSCFPSSFAIEVTGFDSRPQGTIRSK